MAWPLRVVELFAGVGGFRLGLEGVPDRRKSPHFRFIWSNQWEPATKTQHASDVYVARFGGEGHANEDISKVEAGSAIPDHDLMVGGFPCQDYSVARTLNQAAGLVGKKGVLWWEIRRILKEKGDRAPRLLLLENVDRLLKSPASQRGRDFAVMLASLADLGYAVEWRVINAADYGMPQKRRRVFLLAYHRSLTDLSLWENQTDWVFERGPLARAFPVRAMEQVLVPTTLEGDLAALSESFNRGSGHPTPFENCGIMVDRRFWTFKTSACYAGEKKILGDILVPESDVPPEYYLSPGTISAWRYLKGAKAEQRVDKKTGHKYFYSEGPIPFPDRLDQPSRTIVTGEGGSGPSRFKHVVQVRGRFRRLVPRELERLNMFPDDHTRGASDVRRAFMMGNALVVGVVRRIGLQLVRTLKDSVRGKPSVDHVSARDPVVA